MISICVNAGGREREVVKVKRETDTLLPEQNLGLFGIRFLRGVEHGQRGGRSANNEHCRDVGARNKKGRERRDTEG